MTELNVAGPAIPLSMLGERDSAQFWYHLPDALIEVDFRTETITFLSRMAEHLFGYDQGDLPAGLELDTLFTSESMTLYETWMDALLGPERDLDRPYRRYGAPVVHEVSLRHKDGTEILTEAQGSFVLDAESRPLGLRLILRDVSERRRADQWVEAQASLLERITTGDALTSVLDDLCLLVESIEPHVYCSVLLSDPETGRLTRFAGPSIPVSQRKGLDGFRMRYGKDLKPVHTPVKSFGRTPGLEKASKYGKESRIVDTLMFPILGAGRNVLGTFGTYSRAALDLNEGFMQRLDQAAHLAGVAIHRQKAAEENVRLEAELRESQKLDAIGRLASGIAHDFNNALAVTVGHSSLIRSQAEFGSDLYKDATAILEASERAADLTKQLLAFGRKQELRLRRLSVDEVMRNLAHLADRVVGEKIQVVVRIADGLPPVMADSSQLEQVLMNLALNARDSMPGGGVLTFAATLDGAGSAGAGTSVVVSVSDTGCGMDADTVARAVEPYFTTKAMTESSGLGLSTVHGIVSQLGGHLQIESEVGSGTTVSLFLPTVA